MKTAIFFARPITPTPIKALGLLFILVAAIQSNQLHAEDQIEFMSGTTLKGTVTRINSNNKKVEFEVTIAGRVTKREFTYAQIHAVTYRGKRYVLTPKSSTSTTDSSTNQSARKSKTEIERIIRSVGSSKPDWFDSTTTNFPRSLDLSFPLKPPKKGWNNQVNVGQYIWDIINPNPSRWRSGIVMMYRVMDGHQGDTQLLIRDKKTLAAMYFRLFQDYPRAAYWYRQANVSKGTPESVILAECYYRMGSKSMALELLTNRTLTANAIKLLGDMGETKRALQLAESYAKAGRIHEAFLMAGDACRLAEDYDRAIAYYQKVLNAQGARNKDYDKRFKGRARDSIDALRLFELLDVTKLADGTYSAQSTGYNGPIAVEVTINDKKITDVKITRHQEKQFYSALNDTTAQIIDKQGVVGVDATSRATITSAAIVNATAKALAK